jgi:hypothetical protein
MHIHSIILRALRQRATENIDMAVGPEKGKSWRTGAYSPPSQCTPRRAGKPSRLMQPQGFLKLEMDQFLKHVSREDSCGKLASKF